MRTPPELDSAGCPPSPTDGGHDPLAGHVSEHLVFELGRTDVTGVDKGQIDGLADDA